jgi:glycosyltransferase involved in cell wall biosynthesis
LKDLTVIIITRNEERNITPCLESVAWAGEIVVVDSESRDGTVGLARAFTPHVFVRAWKGYAEAKQFALSQATGEWILWLDADERVTPELSEAIRGEVLGKEGGFDGYEIGRRAYFLGKWIRHAGWYPGYTLRLFRRSSVRFTGSRVHEKAEIGGRTGRLRGGDLLHYTDETLYHYFAKFNRYTTLAAQDLRSAGRHFSLWDVFARPPYLFVKMYLLKAGFLDGMHGLVLSLLSASYVFVKYAKLWDLDRPPEG